ncbi:unnamed protein product [Orchesella dallaii]|uniref:Protein kinase domain-containing protein n=1 Tax=Orchesella dallaii TaxID=48710 RepID=A0ABP1RPE6_9HEXA
MVRLITLVSYFYIATGAFQSIQMDDKNASNKFRDVTDPLNALMQGQISSVDFFTKSGFVENGTETKTKLNLYSPDCSTIQECVDEINTVGRFWNETLGRDLLDLTMSITLNNHTLAKLIEDNALNVKLRRPDFQTNYLVNINESVACDDLPDMRNEVWNYLTGFNGRRYGIGINEELIHCIAATERIRYSTEWAVVYFKFRGTVGIPESFGMFRKRMVSLHAESAEVLLRYSIHHSRVLPKLCYYPTVQAEWDEYHYKLFENYMEHWQNEKIDGMELIIRSKLLSFTQTFSVVPYIKYPIDSWYAPSSVQAFSKHFKNIILEYDEWKFWNSDGRKALYNSVKIAPIYNKIEVILKYSFAKKNGTTHVNQKPIQDILEALQIVNEKSSMEPFVLKSILFNIERRENNNYSLQIDTNIGQQITSHGVNVGCVCLFLPELVIKSVAAGVVQACKEINGTLYILYHPRIYMSADPVDPSYYENNVRKILESAKELRTFILKLHPTAQVYFDFPIISSVDVCQRDNGVHIDLSIFDVQAIISDARIVKILKEKTEKLDINIGILINSTTCMEVFRRILFRNLSISYILTPLNYLVFYAGRKMWRPLPLGIPSKIPPSDHNIIPPNDPDKIPPNDPDKILPNDHDKIPPNDQSQMSVTVIVAVVLMVILVVGLLACSAFHYMRYKQMRQFLSNEEVKEFLNGKSQPTEISVIKESQMCTSADYMKFHKDYDLQLADLWTDQQCLLGTGNFGVVYKGTANGIPAAVKQPNKNCTKGSFKSCLSEVKVHCYIGVHTNIVGFLGAYTKEIHKG